MSYFDDRLQFHIYEQEALGATGHSRRFIDRLCARDQERNRETSSAETPSRIRGRSHGVFRRGEIRHAATRSRVLSSTERPLFPTHLLHWVPRNAYADIVKIGEEKAPWYCNKYNVYVAFEFETTEPHGTVTDARDSDRLETTSLFPWLEECL
jgi:hypothetical protein